jgi:putative PIN family toxin of toxin-antitoxin system
VILHVVERDPDDDRVLECAVTAKAELIVTGDSDLLNLVEYAGIEII